MKINKIHFHNFRIYRGDNEVLLSAEEDKNINIIAGKNGFGKTTFLTSLIWVFYGKMMAEVEDKYRKDIKNAGGYDVFLKSLLNRGVATDYANGEKVIPLVSVEIELKDLLIPSIPCKSVIIKRSYDLRTESEEVHIFIDGLENELTKEVGFEVFINDFILPREIAKFFFFDAEKIVSLAEAKTKSELRNLSKAYSEVLGIKKYEDLKKNLETLLTKLRRGGASPEQQVRLQELLDKEAQFKSLIELNLSAQLSVDSQISSLKLISEDLQEKLIREGNGVTLEELQKMKSDQIALKEESYVIRAKLKKLMDIAPLVIAGSKLKDLHTQLAYEQNYHAGLVNKTLVYGQLHSFAQSVLRSIEALDLSESQKTQIDQVLRQTLNEKEVNRGTATSEKVLLDFTAEQFRNFEAVYQNIKTAFSSQFNAVVQEEKNNRVHLSKILYKIKQAEARKDNPLALKLRENKDAADKKIMELLSNKNSLLEELGGYKNQLATNFKILSEFEKKFNAANTDHKKYEVTENLLSKINSIIKRIKQDKKYSLQKAIVLGLKAIMHKNDFIHDVKVNVDDDVMDIDLFDKHGNIIDKDSLSKGEQQLYATALLKALVDESGIKFPVFIDSPLQKFDKYHSKNIIKEFYPAISSQVVLFPLLEKELSELEYEYLKPHVNKVYQIENFNEGSVFKSMNVDQLFHHLKREQDVYAN